ncbi:hypothetical protein FOH38_01980 [Lysinibacillus fusiformis]|nr:hypothetical protein FOH38_01980 [Lysinibacillus fusiformis]
MLRKNKDGSIETFHVEDLKTKQLIDTERKKERCLKSMVITETNKKNDLHQRQRMASDLRKIKVLKKEVLS